MQVIAVSPPLTVGARQGCCSDESCECCSGNCDIVFCVLKVVGKSCVCHFDCDFSNKLN